MPKKLYRYEKVHYGESTEDVRLVLKEFNVIAETPKGYWFYPFPGSIRKQWTSSDATRRYAYPTPKEALENYIHRTRRSISIMNWRIEIARFALSEAKKLKAEQSE